MNIPSCYHHKRFTGYGVLNNAISRIAANALTPPYSLDPVSTPINPNSLSSSNGPLQEVLS